MVREISEIEAYLRLSENVNELIDQGRWGMASDTLRYDLLKYSGGVYADLNYKFARDVEGEIHKYDFFTVTLSNYRLDNFFFGSKADHPVLDEVLNLVDRNFNNPPEYISSLGEKGSRLITDLKTAVPITIAYYKAANRDGTVDVVYPLTKGNNDHEVDHDFVMSIYDLFKEYLDCDGVLKQTMDVIKFNEYIYDNEISGEKEKHFIGEDSKQGLTWINPEWDKPEIIEDKGQEIYNENSLMDYVDDGVEHDFFELPLENEFYDEL